MSRTDPGRVPNIPVKIVQQAHVTTLHGGVGLTMARVREEFWIPRLQKLTKRLARKCSRCKRFQAVAFANLPPAPLPRGRTEGNRPSNVIGVDFAGPGKYRDKHKEEQKAYVVLYCTNLSLKSVMSYTTQICQHSVVSWPKSQEEIVKQS